MILSTVASPLKWEALKRWYGKGGSHRAIVHDRHLVIVRTTSPPPSPLPLPSMPSDVPIWGSRPALILNQPFFIIIIAFCQSIHSFIRSFSCVSLVLPDSSATLLYPINRVKNSVLPTPRPSQGPEFLPFQSDLGLRTSESDPGSKSQCHLYSPPCTLFA